MSDYRRLYVPGGSYFFTVVTHRRRPLFAIAQRVEELRRAFRLVKARRPFEVVAAVILPDHFHCVWRLPEGDCDFSTRWQMIKTEFSRHIPSSGGRDGPKAVWQPRFWEHWIRDENDLRRHLDYIHYNPVKHRLSPAPAAWPYSSFHRFARMGWYEEGMPGTACGLIPAYDARCHGNVGRNKRNVSGEKDFLALACRVGFL